MENAKESRCRITWHEAEVPIEEYLEKCVDVPTFLECCKNCGNYEKVWSCPPYDFHPEDYWAAYDTFRILGMKIFLPESLTAGTYEGEERDRLLQEVVYPYKKELDSKLLAMEKEVEGSISLSGGSCLNCASGTCTRPSGLPCRCPEKMRYSIESLGGNVGLTVRKYLHQELLWMDEGKLPQYFILVGGLLMGKREK